MTRSLFSLTFVLVLSTLASAVSLPKRGDVKASDIDGSGYIAVLKSNDRLKASPADKVGCVGANGQFTKSKCAVFTRQADYPYTLSTRTGNCTFGPTSYDLNTDSRFKTPAFHCYSGYQFNINDQLYTIPGFTYPFLCKGDVSCFYDAKSTPATTDQNLDVWQYKWGTGQLNITPGHVQLMFMWESIKSDEVAEAEAAEIANER